MCGLFLWPWDLSNLAVVYDLFYMLLLGSVCFYNFIFLKKIYVLSYLSDLLSDCDFLFPLEFCCFTI